MCPFFGDGTQIRYTIALSLGEGKGNAAAKGVFWNVSSTFERTNVSVGAGGVHTGTKPSALAGRLFIQPRVLPLTEASCPIVRSVQCASRLPVCDTVGYGGWCDRGRHKDTAWHRSKGVTKPCTATPFRDVTFYSQWPLVARHCLTVAVAPWGPLPGTKRLLLRKRNAWTRKNASQQRPSQKPSRLRGDQLNGMSIVWLSWAIAANTLAPAFDRRPPDQQSDVCVCAWVRLVFCFILSFQKHWVSFPNS